MGHTLFDKIWNNHVIKTYDNGTSIIYIDRHLVHEVTSPQAFNGLTLKNMKVRRPDLTIATVDHNIPTINRHSIINKESKEQIDALSENVKNFGIKYFGMDDKRQGIVHVVGPEQGFTLPGMTIVCGDSHTATHGAFGSLAFGIGTSEVEHVLATQTLLQKPAKNMRITVDGDLRNDLTAKDIILTIIGKIGTAGGNGYVIEFAGKAIEKLSMESRMTICNMTIEAGARAGLIAPDETTFKYLKNKPMAPKGDEWQKAVENWRKLPSDDDAIYEKEVFLHTDDISPMVSWGTSPEDVVSVDGKVPLLDDFSDEEKKNAAKRSLEYMGIKEGQKISDIRIDKVFIGSCTNARIEDLRTVANFVKGKKVAKNVDAMVVPGSGLVKIMAEEEGIDKILKEAGFEWRMPGCSMCLGMNDDKLKDGERCASTSNRNFEGRQGKGGRTHLMSPILAAASAIRGKISDARDFI